MTTYTKVSELAINVACDVQISRATGRNVEVSVHGEDSDVASVSVSKQGRVLHVRHSGGNSGGTTIIQNGSRVTTFSSSGGSSFVNTFSGGTVIQSIGNGVNIMGGGDVYVNGKRVDGGEQVEPRKPLLLKIACPDGLDLTATLKGIARLSSSPSFGSCDLSLQGSTSVAVKGKSMEIDCSGSTDVTASILGGELYVDCSGSAQIDVNGDFSKARVSLSGSASISTNGHCRGDYRANASGCGSIRHRGDVSGRVRESSSGMARISI